MSIAPGPRAASPPPVPLYGVTFGPIQLAHVDFVTRQWLSKTHWEATGLRRDIPVPAGIAHGNYQFFVDQGGLFGTSPDGIESPRRRPVWLAATELPGTNGSFDGIVMDHLRPYVLAWDVDAKLSTALISPVPAPFRLADITQKDLDGLEYVAWPVVFTSEARQETMTVYVEPGRIVALLVHWEIATPMPSPRVSEAEARSALKAALRDPTAQSVEEVWDQDYFLGVPFRNPVGSIEFHAGPGPIMPQIERTEPLYTDANLGDAKLEDGFGRMVWRFENSRARWTMEPSYTLGADGLFRDVQTAEGIVDANTGAVVRFRRSFRETFAGKPLYPSPPAPLRHISALDADLRRRGMPRVCPK